MPVDPQEIVVSLEEEVPSAESGGPRRLRLSATVRGEGGRGVSADAIAEAVRTLSARWKEAREALPDAPPASTGPRTDRSLEELLDEYRPKSPALVDALLWEGELTPPEHQALRERVLATATPAPPAPAPRRPSPAPSSAPPASSSAPGPERGNGPTGPPRPVPELLRSLELKTIKDANRARYERKISFDEWSALKAHFEPKG